VDTPTLDENAKRKRDAWAEKRGVDTYVRDMGVYALRRDESIVGRMLGRGPAHLLDIPCGTGRYLATASELGFQVIAADYSPSMLSVARQHEGVPFVRADVFRPPFMPGSFDVILVSRLLFHYAYPERIVAGLLPLLRPNGRMVFDVLNPYSTRWWASQFLRLLRPDPARQLYFESPAHLERSLGRLGCEVIERRSAYLLPTRAYRGLPRLITRLADAVESILPSRLRVVTYWHIRTTHTYGISGGHHGRGVHG